VISAAARRKYRAQRRQDPHVDAWEKRTRNAALSRLARQYPAAFLELLEQVRAEDPRPEASRDEQAA
jgi:hypothetical protein